MSETATTLNEGVEQETLDRLETIAWGERHFGSLLTNRQFPRRVMLRLVKRGLARSVGMAVLCDDDGWTMEPERYREGFALTDAGRALLAEAHPTIYGADRRPR